MLLGEPHPEISVSVENYLQAMYKLEEREERISNTRLAEVMNVSGATAVGMIKRLTRQGLVMTSDSKEVVMTPRGRDIAESVVRRHRLAERLLTELLGVERYRAHEEAHRLEHAISPHVEAKLSQALNYPVTCPWGHPIPGLGGQLHPPNTKTLDRAQAGEEGMIERMPEEDARLLEFFDTHGLRPGVRILVKEVAPFKGTITVVLDSEEVILGIQVAARVMIRLGDNPNLHGVT